MSNTIQYEYYLEPKDFGFNRDYIFKRLREIDPDIRWAGEQKLEDYGIDNDYRKVFKYIAVYKNKKIPGRHGLYRIVYSVNRKELGDAVRLYGVAHKLDLI